jgi:hypothetical protein
VLLLIMILGKHRYGATLLLLLLLLLYYLLSLCQKFVVASIHIACPGRNLPESIDTAITAPTDAMVDDEEEDSDIEVYEVIPDM